MKKRFFVLSFLFLFVTVLTSCNGIAGTGGGLDLGHIDVEGVEGEKVDTKANSISFSVPFNQDTFNLDTIKVANGVMVSAEDKDGGDLGRSLKLNEGTNSFTIVFKLGEASAAWKLIITREKEVVVPVISSIKVVEAASSYKINDEFKGGKLLITYSDGKTKKIDLLLKHITGFDTKTAGSKKLTVNYEGKSCEFTITVEAAPVISVASIAMKEFDKDYLVGDDFKSAKITVTMSDASTKDVNVTKDMLTGFNTSAVGDVVVSVSYEGKTTTFTITVSKKAPVISYELGEVKKEYNAGEMFVGKIIKTTDGVKSEIEITPEMLTGFDNLAAGLQHVVVKYDGFEATVDVTVTVLALSDDDIFNAMAAVAAIYSMDMTKDAHEQYEALFNECLKTIKAQPESKDIIAYLKEINVTHLQALELKAIIEDDALDLINFYRGLELTDTPADLAIAAKKIDDKLLNTAKDAISRVACLFEGEQIYALLSKNIELNANSESYGMYQTYDEAKKEIINVLSKELVDRPDAKEFKEFLNTYTKVCTSLPKDRVIDATKALRAVALKVCEIKNEDILELLSIFNKEELSFTLEIDNVHRLGRILKDVVAMPELKVLGEVYVEAALTEPISAVNTYLQLKDYKMMVSYICDKLPVLLEYLEGVDLETLKAIDGLLNSYMSQAEMNYEDIVVISKAIGAIYKEICPNPAEIVRLVEFASKFMPDAEAKLTLIIVNINKIASIKINGSITPNQMEEINGLMEEIRLGIAKMPKFGYDDRSDLVLHKGITLEEFLIEFNRMKVFFMNKDPYKAKPEDFTNLNDIKADLNKGGLHYANIKVGEDSYSIPYYIYDDIHKISIIPYFNDADYTHNVIYCDKDGKPTSYIDLYRLNDPHSDREVKEIKYFLDESYMPIYLHDINTIARVSYKFIDESITLIGEKTTDIELGILKIDSSYGTEYRAVNYSYATELKPTSYSLHQEYDDIHAILQNSDFNTLYITYNNGVRKDKVSLHELDSSKPGEVVYNYNGYEFKFIVMTPEEYNRIVGIENIEYICLEELDHCLINSNNYVELKLNSGYKKDIEITKLLDVLGYTDPSYKLNLVAQKLIEFNDYAFTLQILNEDKLVKEFSFTGYTISKEEYNRVSFDIKNFKDGVLLKDEEYEKFITLSEADMLKMVRDYFNNLIGIIDGPKHRQEYIKRPLEYLDKNDIPYHITANEMDGYYLFNLVVRDNVLISIPYISETENKLKANGINIYPDGNNLLVKDSYTSDELIDILVNNARGDVHSICRYEINGLELKEFLNKNITGITAEYSNHEFVVTYVAFEKKNEVSFKASSLDDLEFKVAGMDAIYTMSEIDQAQLEWLYNHHLFTVDAMGHKIPTKDIKFIDLLANDKETVVQFEASYMGAKRTLEYPYVMVSPKPEELDWEMPRYVAAANPAAPTESEILNSFEIRYHYTPIYCNPSEVLKAKGISIDHIDVNLDTKELTAEIRPSGDKLFTMSLDAKLVDRYLIELNINDKNSIRAEEFIYSNSKTIDEFLANITSIAIIDINYNKLIYDSNIANALKKAGLKTTKIADINGYPAYSLEFEYLLHNNVRTVVLVDNDFKFIEKLDYYEYSIIKEATAKAIAEKINTLSIRGFNGKIEDITDPKQIEAYLAGFEVVSDKGDCVEIIIPACPMHLFFRLYDGKPIEANNRTIGFIDAKPKEFTTATLVDLIKTKKIDFEVYIDKNCYLLSESQELLNSMTITDVKENEYSYDFVMNLTIDGIKYYTHSEVRMTNYNENLHPYITTNTNNLIPEKMPDLAYIIDGLNSRKIQLFYNDDNVKMEYINYNDVKELNIKINNSYVDEKMGMYVLEISLTYLNRSYNTELKFNNGKPINPDPDTKVEYNLAIDYCNYTSAAMPNLDDIRTAIINKEIGLFIEDNNYNKTNVLDVPVFLDRLAIEKSFEAEDGMHVIIYSYYLENRISNELIIKKSNTVAEGTIKDVLAGKQNDKFSFDGKVLLAGDYNYIVADNTGIIRVQVNNQLRRLKVGEVVRFNGFISNLKNNSVLFNPEAITEALATIECEYPVNELTAQGFIDYAALEKPIIQHVCFKGTIVADRYINVRIPGIENDKVMASLQLTKEQKSQISLLNNIDGEFVGYVAYTSASRFVQVFVESYKVVADDNSILDAQAKLLLEKMPQGVITKQVVVSFNNQLQAEIIKPVNGVTLNGSSFVFSPVESVSGALEYKLTYGSASKSYTVNVEFKLVVADATAKVDAFSKLTEEQQKDLSLAGSVEVAPGIFITIDKGVGSLTPIYNTGSHEIRLYEGNTMTIKFSKNVEMLEFIGKDLFHDGIAVDNGKLDTKMNTWYGASDAITITNTKGKKITLNEIRVYYTK